MEAKGRERQRKAGKVGNGKKTSPNEIKRKRKRKRQMALSPYYLMLVQKN